MTWQLTTLGANDVRGSKMKATMSLMVEPQKPPTTILQYPICSMGQPSSLWDTLCKVKNTKGQESLGASLDTLTHKVNIVLTLKDLIIWREKLTPNK